MTAPYQPTAAEKQELADLTAYLRGHAEAGTLASMPEGSVAAVLNKASPNVRAHLAMNQNYVKEFRESGGRSMPFAEKRYLSDLDIPKETRAIMQQADTEEVTHGLLQRMGTTPPDNSPPSLREHIEAVMDNSQE